MMLSERNVRSSRFSSPLKMSCIVWSNVFVGEKTLGAAAFCDFVTIADATLFHFSVEQKSKEDSSEDFGSVYVRQIHFVSFCFVLDAFGFVLLSQQQKNVKLF